MDPRASAKSSRLQILPFFYLEKQYLGFRVNLDDASESDSLESKAIV